MTSSVPNDGLRDDSVGVKVLHNPPVNHDNMRQNDSPTDCLTENLLNYQSEANCQQVVEMEKYDG